MHIQIHIPYMGPGPAAAVRPSRAHVRYMYLYMYVHMYILGQENGLRSNISRIQGS